MNVRGRCAAGDSIYANNANRKFCTKYEIVISFVRKGREVKDEPLRKYSDVNSQKKGALGLNEVLIPKVTLLAHKDKSTEQEDRNPVDFLRNTYDKCHTDN